MGGTADGHADDEEKENSFDNALNDTSSCASSGDGAADDHDDLSDYGGNVQSEKEVDLNTRVMDVQHHKTIEKDTEPLAPGELDLEGLGTDSVADLPTAPPTYAGNSKPLDPEGLRTGSATLSPTDADDSKTPELFNQSEYKDTEPLVSK